MQKVYFYIGSNNTTGELERAKAEAIIAKHFESFSAYEVIGYWHGNREKTLKVEILTEEVPARIAAIAKELKVALDQDAILMEIVESNFALVQ